MELWVQTRKHPDVPPFSGGVLDAWPAWAADTIAIARNEQVLLSAFLASGGGRV